MITETTHRLHTELNDFESMSEKARVWIYQSERDLDSGEIQTIELELKKFTSGWTAHNHQLNALSKVLYGRFVVLAVDEEPQVISGCGIDKSVHKINEIERSLNVQLIDRANMGLLINEAIQTIPFSAISNQYNSKTLLGDQLVFNSMVQNMKDLRGQFLVRFEESPFHRLV